MLSLFWGLGQIWVAGKWQGSRRPQATVLSCRDGIRTSLPKDLAPYLPKGWTFGNTDTERDVAKLFRTALTVIVKSVRFAAAPRSRSGCMRCPSCS